MIEPLVSSTQHPANTNEWAVSPLETTALSRGSSGDLRHENDVTRTLTHRVFETISCLNDTAIKHALAMKINESFTILNVALSELGVTVQSPASVYARMCSGSLLQQQQIGNLFSSSSAVFAGLAGTGQLVDHRLEYDEGWDSCSRFMHFDILDDSYETDSAEMASILLYNMGQALFLLNRAPEVLDLFLEALHLASSCPSHSNESSGLRIVILHAIGYVQYWNRDIKEAIETFQAALNISNVECCKLSTAVTLNCLGVLHFHLTKPDTENSLDYLLRAMAIQRHVLGEEHRVLATTLNNLGRVHFTADRLEQALKSYDDSLQIRRKILGNEHPDVAATVYNAGQTLHQMGDLDNALDRYKEFVRITLTLDRPNRYLVVVLKCIAIIYHETKDYQNSLSYYDQALAVGKNILGVHADVASILNKIGNLYYEMGDYDASIRVYREGLSVERVVFDDEHPNITVTLSNIAQVYKQRGDMASSLRLYNQVLAIQRKKLDRTDPNWL